MTSNSPLPQHRRRSYRRGREPRMAAPVGPVLPACETDSEQAVQLPAGWYAASANYYVLPSAAGVAVEREDRDRWWAFTGPNHVHETPYANMHAAMLAALGCYGTWLDVWRVDAPDDCTRRDRFLPALVERLAADRSAKLQAAKAKKTTEARCPTCGPLPRGKVLFHRCPEDAPDPARRRDVCRGNP